MPAGEVVGGAATAAAADSMEPADVAAVGVLAVAAAVGLDRACLLRMEID